jgi:hypothetical protein
MHPVTGSHQSDVQGKPSLHVTTLPLHFPLAQTAA